MKIWNNEKRSTILEETVSQQAASLTDHQYASLLKGESEILSLRDAATNAEYLERYVEIVRKRQGVNPAQYSQPRSPGLKGSFSYIIRLLLWRILRYQHFWVAFHQNAINAMHAETLDFEHQERTRKTKQMETRIERLEKQLNALQTEKH